MVRLTRAYQAIKTWLTMNYKQLITWFLMIALAKGWL